MPDSTQSKAESYVQSIDWGSHNPDVTYLSSPTRTVYKKTETSSFAITVHHPSGSNPASQTHEGKTIEATLCDGNWTIKTTA